jgi:pyrimidine-nucleoside phosphorylase
MVEIGESLGKKVVAVISDMNQPLGRAIGNALEVIEAIETLRGFGPPDFLEHCLVVASQMLLLGGYAKDAKEARKKLIYLIESGKALEKFEEWVKAQGGDARVTSDTSLLPSARIVEEIESPRSGYISQIDAQEVGIASMQLGAGRMKKEEEIDPAVGVILYKKIGDYVKKKEPLVEIHANDEERLAQAKERLLAAYDWSDEPVSPPPPIYQVIGKISNKQQIE